MLSLKTRRWRMILLSDWWLNRTNKRFWFVDEFFDVLVRKSSAEWSWSEREDSRRRTMRRCQWTTATKYIENVENNCCCRMTIRKRYISWQSLMRCVELDFEDWDENKKKNINKIVNDFRFRDDMQFKRVLIRDAEIRDIEDINERVEMIWLKRNVFVYKQRDFLFDMCRFEIQRNQKFDRFIVNFCSFDFNCLDSNNLNSLREFDDSFVRSALRIRECEIFAWKHDDQLAFEFRDWWDELRDDVE